MAFLLFLDDHADLIGVLLTMLIFILGLLIERKTKKIQTALTWKEFREPIITFSNEVIFTLSDAAALCETDHVKYGPDEYWKKYSSLLTSQTSFIDRARLVIPNLYLADDSAYGGLRHKALDCLVAGYQVSKLINYNSAGYNVLPVADVNNPTHKLLKNALAKLPDQNSILMIEAAKSFTGWSCKRALIEVKRQYVNEISRLIQARQWANDILKLSEKSGIIKYDL